MPILKSKSKILTPTRTIVLSFLGIIIIGATLLCLPISSKSGEFTAFADSLFTATSATCVTGLVVHDTYTHWNMFGQIIILIMIQLGGLGLLTFASFFNFALGKKLGLRSMQLAKESANYDSISDIKQLVGMIMKISFSIELIGAFLLSFVFVPKYGVSGIFTSIFLSISAFCNAGFDVLGNEGEYISLTNYADNPIVMGTIMLLIISGGLGFVVWYDLFNYRKTKKLILHTKLVLITTASLIIIATLFLLILEWNNPDTMGGMDFHQKLSRALFQSVTFRTAGFNTIPIDKMHEGSKLAGSFVMFIGAAPGSTGGGIKITTFMVIIMTVFSVIRNKPDTVILKKKVEKDVVYKSLSIIMLSALAVIITTCFIGFANPGELSSIDVIFESVSAFATVGLSSGVTAIINPISRFMIIITMFLGRVGPMSMAYSITASTANRNKNQVIPEGKIMVG